MVDELEESTPAQRALLEGLAGDNPNQLFALEADEDGTRRPRSLVPRAPPRGRGRHPGAALPRAEAALLEVRQRARPGAGDGARGRAPAGERRRADDDLRPARRPGRARAARSPRRWRSAASPSTSPGRRRSSSGAEVRDAIAWLRVLADPDDSAAAARALTRPPVELRPGDLARLTTIARRRKLDMVAGCEAALDSPQFQPEARERIQTFLKLYGTAAGGDGGAARRRLRAAADRGRRPAPPAPLRRPAGGRRAAARALPPGRAGDRLGAARAARLDPRLRQIPERRRRGGGRAEPAARSRPRRAPWSGWRSTR